MESANIEQKLMLRMALMPLIGLCGFLLAVQLTAQSDAEDRDCGSGETYAGQNCSRRDAHVRRCESTKTSTQWAAYRVYQRKLSRCSSGDSSCRTRAGNAYGQAYNSAIDVARRCRERAPSCTTVCVSRPSTSAPSGQAELDCIPDGGVWINGRCEPSGADASDS